MAESAVDRVREALSETPIKSKDLATKLGLTKEETSAALKKLIQQSEAMNVGKKRGSAYRTPTPTN